MLGGCRELRLPFVDLFSLFGTYFDFNGPGLFPVNAEAGPET